MNALTVSNYPTQATEPVCLLEQAPPALPTNRYGGLEEIVHSIEIETDHTQRDQLVHKLFNLENQCRQDLMVVKLLIRADIVPLKKLYRLIGDADFGRDLSTLMENSSLLSRECVDKLKALLRKVEAGSVTFDGAIEAAREIYWHDQRLESALDLVWAPTWNLGQSVIEFLLITGIISQDDINNLQQTSVVPATKLAQLLVYAGALEGCTLQIATRVRFLLNQQKITLEQALAMVKFCLKYNVDVDSIISSCWPIN